MFDLAAIGELLIDFTPSGQNEAGSALFARNPGGAPANVLVAAARLGANTAFVGKVGRDGFGEFLKDVLEQNGVNADNLVMTDKVHTTLAFVQLDSHGDRSFSFYRKPGADIMLNYDEIDASLFQNTGFLHFGSVSLTDEPSRTATLRAARKAKECGAVVSYDPNYRAPLWNSEREAVEQMKAALPSADVVKLSEEELTMLTGETDLERGARMIQDRGAALVLVTLGPKGAFYLCGEQHGSLPTFDVPTIDTNGAGDSFLGAVLFRLRGRSKDEISSLSQDELEDIIAFANAAGSVTTMKHGAIPAMPTREEVERCRKSAPLLSL